MDNTIPTILTFDSGLGGLSILKAIRQQHSYCRMIYCSDNEAFPYGTKSEQEVINRVSDVMVRLQNRFRPDIFVVACNTASTVALPKVRSMIRAPVIGVVPAIKPAAQLSTTANIGLLATPGTIRRQYTQTLIDQFAPKHHWIKIGSSELVQLAEQKMYGEAPESASLQDAIRTITAPLAKYSADELDTVVLACTHFPLLLDELKQALPAIRHWVDSSEAIANRVGFWLHELRFCREENAASCTDNTLVFTRRLENESRLADIRHQMDFSQLLYL